MTVNLAVCDGLPYHRSDIKKRFMRFYVLAISLALAPSVNRYYQYGCVEVQTCSNVFAVLIAILESSLTSSFLCSIIVFNASIFANMALFAILVVTIALSAKVTTVLA